MTRMSPRLKPLSVAVALLAVLAALPALAAETAEVRARASGEGLELQPARSAPAWQLRISAPDGRVAEDEFLDGEPVRIDARLFGSARWADGSYRYELTPVLGDSQRGEATAGGGTSAPAVRAATGNFVILAGRVYVVGSSTEPGAGAGAANAVGAAPAASPGGPTPQTTFADDLIVQGSACVGLDCVTGESFGFDTIRLKENNTQIAFDDTSSSPGFPANDWAIVANDSASGGASRLFFRDVTGATEPFSVAAAAPTASFFMSSTGRIGLGTSVPVLHLQLNKSDTPAIRLEQNSSGGFTAQTWDVAGNEANFFVRDVTSGSRLPFRIRPGAPTSSLDIAASGNVGIGTASPLSALHVSDDAANVSLRLTATTGLLGSWNISNNAASGRMNITDDATNVRIPLKIGLNGVNNLLRVATQGTNIVEINGNLNVNGNIQVTGTVGPDYVFGPGFDLPSITDHAAYMFANNHLPNVGAARVNELGQGVMDLGTLSHGMLEELEYAHIYISQLDDTVRELRDELAERDAQMQALQAEVQAIRDRLAD